MFTILKLQLLISILLYVCNPNTCKVQAGESGIQGHLVSKTIPPPPRHTENDNNTYFILLHIIPRFKKQSDECENGEPAVFSASSTIHWEKEKVFTLRHKVNLN